MPPVLATPFKALFLPSSLLIWLLLIGLILMLRRRRAAVWWVGTALALALGALSPIPGWLLHPLEARFAAPAAMPRNVDGIIILGGAARRGMTQDHGQPALNDMAERMTEGMALARRYPHARLVFAGGPPDSRLITESEVARRLFVQLGVDMPRVAFEKRSANTWENAVFTKNVAKPRPGQTWILVTSANHMPRSMGAFRAAGWSGLTPWPCDFRTWSDGRILTPPSLVAGLELIDLAAYEWIGLLSYRLAGRSAALFPAP